MAEPPWDRKLPSWTLGAGEGEGLARLLGREEVREKGGPSLTSSCTAPSLTEMLEATAHMLSHHCWRGDAQTDRAHPHVGALHLFLAL